MSSLAADVSFDFTFPPATPPTAPYYDYDNASASSSLLEVPYYAASRAGHGHGHARSSSNCSAYSSYSAYSFASTPSEQSFMSVAPVAPSASVPASAAASPAPAPPAAARSQIRTHGPLLLPKIRSQDQALCDDASATAAGLLPAPPLKRARTSPASSRPLSRTPSLPPRNRRSASVRRSTLGVGSSSGASKYASPGPTASRHQPIMAGGSTPHRATTPSSVFEATPPPPSLLCQGLDSLDNFDSFDGSMDNLHHLGAKFDYDFGFAAPYPGTVPASFSLGSTWQQQYPAVSSAVSYVPEQAPTQVPAQVPAREASPVSVASASPPPVSAAPPPSTSLLAYLSQHNPAPALVRAIAYPLHDPNTKHYWWDVRQVRAWSAFSAASLVALPGADAVLSCRVPQALLPAAPVPGRAALLPETEADLHALCAAHYLPRVNAALALSSPRPVQLVSNTSGEFGPCFVGTAAGDSAPAAALFGGRPTARVVGLVKSFDRFNTGMRAAGGATNNIKKVEYLRGLAHLHYLMRAHSCRYGFILTEIELVVVRNGTDATPQFGQVEVASVPLAVAKHDSNSLEDSPLTAGLALWGLCMLASDEMAAAAQQQEKDADPTTSLLCSWAAHIGAPAEGTRRKAAERDAWMPPPQLAEKRAAKRARGWVMPEDAVGRKEMGRRGVKY